MTTDDVVSSGAFVGSYTILLWVLGGFFALPLLSLLLVVTGAAGGGERPLWIAFLTTGVSLGCFGVAAARVAGSKPARRLTQALSWVLLVFVPIGTVAWAYWFLSVRHHERQGVKDP